MRILIRSKSLGAEFVHPLAPVPKTAVLLAGFRESKNIRVFPDGWNQAAERFAAGAAAGTVEQLRDLAGRGVTLRHAVIVLTRGRVPELTQEDREYLWRAFGVPVFEQCLGPNNELLASECEAHEGMHIRGEWRGARLKEAQCPCGNPLPRLREPEPCASGDLTPAG